jgi:hypothetical protein
VKGNVLNEASVSYQSFVWNPIPLVESVGLRYQGVLKIGGHSTLQDFDQQRLAFRNDISYTKAGWFGSSPSAGSKSARSSRPTKTG